MKRLLSLVLAICMIATILAMPVESKASTDKGSVTFDKKYTGFLDGNSNSEYRTGHKYTVSIPSDGKILIYFLSDQDQTKISLNTDSGTEVINDGSGWDSGKNQVFSKDIKKGTYYLNFWINGYWSHEDTNYEFMVSFEPSGKTFYYDNDGIHDVKSRPAMKYGANVNGFFTWNDNQEYYRVSVPCDGKVNLSATNDSINGGLIYSIKKSDGQELQTDEKDQWSAQQYISQGKRGVSTYTLKKGNYYLYFRSDYNDQTGKYHFKVNFSLSAPTSLKATNIAGKKVKVTANKSGTIQGYEIRYRVKGSSKWKTIKKSGNKNISYTIKSLKKGKTYEIQTRIKAKVDGKSKYSSWTKKTVKIKK